jgi:DNA-binding NarL/FixJ family response regulator
MGRSGTIFDGASGLAPGTEDLLVETAAKPDLLIVDDDPLITDTLDYVLGRDFNVRVAESRAQARSVLRQLDNAPELALVDLGLPPNPHRPDEGFQLINELLALSPAIKIIVLSGQNDENNARHARALGAIDFVPKPCEPDQLKRLLLDARNIAAAERGASSEDAESSAGRQSPNSASRSGSTRPRRFRS